MTAAGSDGFEGLIAGLLSRLTGDRFFIARSGDQPADALSRNGVAIQAKRYDKKSLDETDFEGDYNKACREFPELDVYVLAATRDTAQLEVLSRKLEESHGVDIFLIGLADAQSPLTTLCVTFWGIVRRFFSTEQLPAYFDAWAATVARLPDVVAAVERLRTDFLHSAHTAESTRRKLDRYRARRFGLDTTASWSNRFAIDLNKSIRRLAPLAALDAWWQEPSRRAAVLIAEEGMGKSWVAATFAQDRAQQDEIIVLWLDSADWAGQTHLQGLVETGLTLAGVSDYPIRKRLAGKALRRWRHRLLIVLDGINERDAKAAAHHLLVELFAPNDVPTRLLFTSRPIPWASDERSLWANTHPVQMTGFTEEELREALERLPTPVARAEISAGLAEIASIPRYFQRAITLRARFRSLANVSKEMVLWTDMLEKIAANDPQIAGKVAWTTPADARRALLALAEGARQLRHADESDRGYRLLLHVFGNDYNAVRHDLAEQRIVVDPAGDDPRPSLAHIRLGFALHLGRFLRSQPGQNGVGTFADALKRELEPLSSQDDITEALFVALQLSALVPDGVIALTPNKRAALLLAWATSHNARIEAPRLQFWADEDVAAYLDFLETLFIDLVSENWTFDLLRPLCSRWQENPDPASPLAQRLRHWLKLVWIETSVRAPGPHVADGHEFPFAKTKHQLILSKIALAIFSKAPPSPELLLDFVLAWATDKMCLEEHSSPAHNDRPAQRFLVPCKELNRSLGPYFRWRYTEHVRPALAVLKNSYSDDALITKACDEITEAFDVFGWHQTISAEVELMNGASLFKKTPQGERARFHECAYLAVRDDLPPLSAEDLSLVAEIIEKVFAAPDFHAERAVTQTDRRAQQYLPWFARYHPQRLVEVGTRFRLAALARAEQYNVLETANNLPYSPRYASSRELLDAARSAALRIIASPTEHHQWNLGECHVLALTCFGAQELDEWFEFAAQHPTLRRHLHFYPTPLLLPLLCPRSVANKALRRAVEHIDQPAVPPKQLESEFEYWADLAGYGCDPDDETNQLITAHLDICPPGNGRRFHLLLLYFRTLSDEASERTYASGELLRHLDAEGWRALHFSGRGDLPWSRLKRDFDLVVNRVGVNVAGSLFAEAGHTDELRRWGVLIFAKASQLLDESTPPRQFWGQTVRFVDASGRTVCSGCEGAAVPDDAPTTPLRPERRFTGFIEAERAKERCEASENRGIQLWLEDMRLLETLPQGILRDFNGVRALAMFRDSDPQRFQALAEDLLTVVVKKPVEAYHLDGFVHATAIVLMPLAPDHAAAITRELREGNLHSDCRNEYDVPATEAAAWMAARDGNARCREFCRDALHRAANDTQLMNHAITAQAEGAGPLLATFCNEWFVSPLARERCLAISLLPWLLEADTPRRLVAAARDDPSGWVRDHAHWAAQVARQELAAREQYRRVLTQSDPNTARTMLEVMRPALTPAALWWRTTMRFEPDARIVGHAEVHAAVTLFWDRVNRVKSSTLELYSRKLVEYLRGEKIADLSSPAPWLE